MTAIGLTPGKVTSYNIAFGIAPHLNAAGRIDDAALAESLFTEKEDTKTYKRQMFIRIKP
jgi:single-stranded-DNA-specific exonuclease